MRSVLRPRLASLDVFATALLLSLGCGSEVIPADGGGNEGGSGGSGAGSNSGGTPNAGGSQQQGGSQTNGGSSSDGGASMQGGSSSVGGSGPGVHGCTNPQPIFVDGQDTGLDQCENGPVRRREEVTCPSSFPDPNTCCGGCPEGQLCSTNGEVACQCVDACFTDADCGPDQLCMCGDPAGICVQAGCQTDADCGNGEECLSWDFTMGCLYVEFECTTPNDTCGGNGDCTVAPNTFCNVQADGHRECGFGGCAIGRPFLVDEVARTAETCCRTDWMDEVVTGSAVDGVLARELGEAWEMTATMEHASIAAFARFSLQLLALGAPADLVERTTQAMADETKHAKMAFSLASLYRGEAVGPTRLPIDHALDGASDAASVIELVIREGCVGETVAALEAGEAHAHARDARVREVLDVIADDESRHAELAWRTVRWALATFGDDVRIVVEREIDALELELRSPLPTSDTRHDAELLVHGVVTSGARARLRRTALRRAVLPCLKALVSESIRAAA